MVHQHTCRQSINTNNNHHFEDDDDNGNDDDKKIPNNQENLTEETKFMLELKLG